MGSKSSSAPPPDPRLVEAQIRSMGIQDEVIQRIMANSEAMMPLQREQMEFGLAAARQAHADSREDRDWMLGRRGMLSGLQDRLVEDARSFDSGERTAQLRDEAFADVNSAFDNARGQGMRAMGRMGVNPNSGKMLAMNNEASLAQATAMAGAGRMVRDAARAEGYALTDRATNALAGYPAMGMQATSAGAGYGLAGLDAANKGLAGMNSGYGAAGTMAGQMGQNATGMYGAQANYKLGADRQAADNNPFGALLGAGAQLGAAWLGRSDRRLKEAVELVGRDESTGLNLYEFSYIDDPEHRRFRGVMADEVRRVRPEAVVRTPDGYDAVNYTLLGVEMVEVAS